ncbi:MAG: SDR family oxidoreductase [Verrucomicrobia bacterium]|nr:SDR family oxidoreductase [Verrucomicrobiota bacterium]MBV8376244.1 SDR family oxidoreductase [Verrucomicrobiota bacterium]
MKILVTGAAGMIGRKFCEALVKRRNIGSRSVVRLTMADAIKPAALVGAPFDVSTLSADISDPGIAESFVADRPEIIYHLAAVVSGEAEADFDKGYRVNLTGTHRLFEAVRQAGYQPRIVFASSIAVFGTPFPETIREDYAFAPLTSYGTQKAIGELLLADFSRRDFFDGIGIRFPTICVRPGKPNKAASGFFSNIIREPLKGEPAVLPVSEDVRHWFASPRAAVDFLFHAGALDLGQLGSRRTLNMPGLSATVGEMIASLKDVAGADCAKLIRRQPDPAIQKMVDGWPRRLDASRAETLGFHAEKSFEEIVHHHIEDESAG